MGDDGCSGENSSCSSLPIELPDLGTGMWIEITMYLLAFLVGGPLNVASMWKLLTARKTLKHPSAIVLLRLHLNIADLITLFIYVPKQVIWLITFGWYGGDILCRLCAFVSTFCFYLHSFVIACIAIDRLLGAWHINSISSSRKAYCRVSRLLLSAWLMATALALPQTLIFKLYELGDGESGIPSKQCATFWMKAKYDAGMIFENPQIPMEIKNLEAERVQRLIELERWYTISHLIFNFVLPTMLIIVSYTTLLFILKGFIKETGVNGTQVPPLLVLTKKHYNSEDENSKVTGTTCVQHDPSSCRRNSNPVLYSGTNSAISKGGDYESKLRHGSTPFVFQDDHSPILMNSPCSKCDAGEFSQTSRGVDDYLRGKREAKKRDRLMGGHHGHNNHRVPVSPFAIGKITKARKEAKRQAALILLAYIVCWSPYNVLSILYATGLFDSASHFDYLNSLIAINPIVNPIIYGVFRKI